ncbi:hypothetical protein [Actinokineospora cianjurensis]|uniref:Uncharacterized protein n=1 Tax=Actinokineospora cianjurensis TaxID=585224 RepID=A0A421B6R3_9PSEU|nr:hypothetical protein [Actinokineospora cianjurensis]RLK60064.1 hypothetical protein CLV68_0561 [Actinokineospora cianjurensis]
MDTIRRILAKITTVMVVLTGLTVLTTATSAHAATAAECNTARTSTVYAHLANDPTPGLRMETWFTLDRATGHIDATTHVHSLLLARGFTSATMAVAYNSCDQVIGVTPGMNAGVDGIWFGNSDRWIQWQRDWDPRISSRVARIEIQHRWNPNWFITYQRLRAIACTSWTVISPGTQCPLPAM